MTANLLSSILIFALILGVPELGKVSEPTEAIDYAPILERIGIRDEPSILDQCDAGYSSIRVTGLTGGHPFVIYRFELGQSGHRLIKRLIEKGYPKASGVYPVSESDWAALVDELRNSGFWTYKRVENYWMPDGHQQWIEACIDGEFGSISVYPDRDPRMSDFTAFLVRLTT